MEGSGAERETALMQSHPAAASMLTYCVIQAAHRRGHWSAPSGWQSVRRTWISFSFSFLLFDLGGFDKSSIRNLLMLIFPRRRAGAEVGLNLQACYL